MEKTAIGLFVDGKSAELTKFMKGVKTDEVIIISSMSALFRVPTGQGKLEKNQGIRVVRERSGENIFFGKVRENEKLVPTDVRFSG